MLKVEVVPVLNKIYPVLT